MKRLVFLLAVFSLLLTACGGANVPAQDSGKLTVVATTSIVADVVAKVGGDNIDLEILLPVGTDPHSFEPTPQDIAKVADAEVVFANGAGLEEFMQNLLESADATNKIVEVSDGIALLEHPAEDHETGDEDHDHEMGDPHTWTDPNNVMIWVNNIEAALSKADPANAETYTANAAAYDAELSDADAWIREQIATIPEANRKIVTDHQLLGYYIEEYGLDMAGAIIPGYSSLSEPSAQELAAIEDAIRQTGVKAVFVGNTVNSNLAERVSEDTGVTLVFFYTGSLSPADGDAPTYLDYLRYNTNAFVEALK